MTYTLLLFCSFHSVIFDRDIQIMPCLTVVFGIKERIKYGKENTG